MPSPYLWSGIPAALYYAYYKNYCAQVPEIFGGEGPLLELLKEKCAILKEEYRPPPLVHESRLMTIVAALGRHRGLIYPFMREILETCDGGEIALDWWDARLTPQSASEVPLVSSSSLVYSLSYYYNSLPPFRLPQMPHFQIPYFGQVKRSISVTGNELTHLDSITGICDLTRPTETLQTDQILTDVVKQEFYLSDPASLSVFPLEEEVCNTSDPRTNFIILPSQSSPNLSTHSSDINLNNPTRKLDAGDETIIDETTFDSDKQSGVSNDAVPPLNIQTLEPEGIVLILPGLTGDSTQNYVHGLVQVVELLGYTAVVMNYRGMAGNLKTPKSYCAADTSDLAEVIDIIKRRHPSVPVLAVGISLGGILLTNYVARCGKENIDSRLAGVMVVSVAWNFFESYKVLEQPLNWLLFNRMLTRALCDVVHRHANVLQPAFDLKALKKVKTLREFDECLTAKMFGFSGWDEYYKTASLHDKVEYIKTPLLALNAADDVFSPYEAIPKEDAKKNPNLCIVVTSHGGHIGFLEQKNPLGRNYVERLFEQFAKAILERVKDPNCTKLAM